MSVSLEGDGCARTKMKRKICLFCYKCVDKEKDADYTIFENRGDENRCSDIDNVNNFIKFLERFVGGDRSKFKITLQNFAYCAISSKKDDGPRLGSCGDCEKIVKSFCDLYHRWRCLELQLEWQLKMLVNIMKSANKVPSRIGQLTDMFTGSEENKSVNDRSNKEYLASFKKSRHAVIRKCNQKLSKSTPSIMLKRLENLSCSYSSQSQQQSIPLLSDSNQSSNDITGHINMNTIVDNAGIANFLGWSLSFAAVALLALPFNELGEVESSPKTHEEISTAFCLGDHPNRWEDFDANACWKNEVLDDNIHDMNAIRHHMSQLPTSRNKLYNISTEDNQVSIDNDHDSAFHGATATDNEVVKDKDIFNKIIIIGPTSLSPEHSAVDHCSENLSVLVENDCENLESDIDDQSPTREYSDDTVEKEQENSTLTDLAEITSKIEEEYAEDNVNYRNEYENKTSSVNMDEIDISFDNDFQEDMYTSSSSSEDETEKKFDVKTEIAQSVNKHLFQCTVCCKVLQHAGSLKRHMTEQHSTFSSTNGMSKSCLSQNTENKSQLMRYYHCKICKLVFKRYCRLRRHKFSKRHKLKRKLFFKKLKRTKNKTTDQVTQKSIILDTEKRAWDNQNIQETFNFGKNIEGIQQLDQFSSDSENLPNSVLPSESDRGVGTLKFQRKKITKHVQQNNEDTPQRYSLRGNRKRSYHGMALENEGEKNKDTNFQLADDKHNNIEVDDKSVSDESVVSSDIPDTDTESDEDNRPKKTIRIPESQRKFVNCELDWCKKYRVRKEKYRNHQKLHAPGKYKCQFCKTVEDSVIKLSEHERTKHYSGNSVVSSNEIVFNCSRCTFSSHLRIRYYWHFAEVHVGGFDRNRVDCFICGTKFPKLNKKKEQKEHFKMYHDTTGIEPKEIHSCSFEGCTAYFKTAVQLSKHQDAVHRTLKLPVKVKMEKNDVTDKEKRKKQNASKRLPYTEENGYFICKLCKKGFEKIGSFDNHKRNFHKKSNKFICKVDSCRYGFKTLNNLEEHEKLHGKFNCNFCDVVKTYAPDLSLHELEHAFRSEPAATTKQSKKCAVENVQRLNCPRCPYSCERESMYIRHHLKSHINLTTSSHTCPICNAEGMAVKFQLIHFRSHHNTDGLDSSQIFNCDQCTAYFIRIDQLNQHKMRIHNNGSNKCPECFKTLASYHTLRFHMERVHPDRFLSLSFPCEFPLCKRRFPSQKQLDSHTERLHKNRAGEELAKCSKCGKQFRGETTLKAHMNLVHTARSHVCSECGKAFKSKHGLVFHMTYHNPDSWAFQCPTCGKKCADKCKLEMHQRTHTKEKPYVCQCCGEKYAHRHNWKNHMRTKHPGECSELENVNVKKGNYLSRKGSKKGDIITANCKEKT